MAVRNRAVRARAAASGAKKTLVKEIGLWADVIRTSFEKVGRSARLQIKLLSPNAWGRDPDQTSANL